MRPSLDGEDGESFWAWIQDHYSENTGTTYIVQTLTGIIFGTFTLGTDDRNVMKEYDLTGLIFGGVNIQRHYRGLGLSEVLIEEMHKLMEPQNDYWLFTANNYFEVGIQRMGWELVQTISTMEFGDENLWKFENPAI